VRHGRRVEPAASKRIPPRPQPAVGRRLRYAADPSHDAGPLTQPDATVHRDTAATRQGCRRNRPHGGGPSSGI